MRRGLPLVAAVLLLAAGPAAWGSFGQGATATTTFSAGSLAAPTGLTGAGQCGLLSYEVRLSWTATTTPWADGYEVSRATSSAGPYTVVPRPSGTSALATTRTVTGLSAATTYWFRVTATRQAWRSAPAQVSATTPVLCLF